MPHAESPTSPTGPLFDDVSLEFKKIILCFDGTGNTFSGTNADTNVVKILRKLDRNHTEQFHYYQTGIGTYDVSESSIHKSVLGEARSSVSKALDQGFGTTFDAHIMAGYRFLMRYYEPDAKIYIFGFSRGAFTAKYLARMINVVGLLCKGNEEMVPFAYRLYARSLELQSADLVNAQKAEQKLTGKKHSRFRGTEWHMDGDVDSPSESEGLLQGEDAPPVLTATPTSVPSASVKDDTNILANKVEIVESAETKASRAEIEAFGKTFCRSAGDSLSTSHQNIQVFFLGLWDCVNSVAVVEKNAPAPIKVSGTAKYIRHAVAVDERRIKFKPALFAQDIRNDAKKDKKEVESDILEVWFPGNHGDVGGGWPAFEQKKVSDMGWLEYLGSIWKSLKASKLKDVVLDDDHLQMSDMALEWMIREVDLVGQLEPRAKVHWCPDYDKFKTLMADEKAVTTHITRGFMHDCLSFGYGSSFFKVLMWKFMEHLPFVPRWELNDPENPDDRGWESYRGWPNRGASRDIPRGAILHESVKQRLALKSTEYYPMNNHGATTSSNQRAGEPCLRTRDGAAAEMRKVTVPQKPGKRSSSEERDGRHGLWKLKNN